MLDPDPNEMNADPQPWLLQGPAEGGDNTTVPADFRLVLRKMHKKDVTTRLKALQEFQAGLAIKNPPKKTHLKNLLVLKMGF
jgi:hypothetical protein